VLKATTILDHLIISMATCHISFFYCFFFPKIFTKRTNWYTADTWQP